MLQRFDHRAGHYALLTVVWAALCLPNLGGPSLWDIDEGNNATCAYEMSESGNWVVPTFNNRLREDKPALLYWLQATAYDWFGINEFAARLPSALAALLAILATYELGRRMFGTATGLLGGVILASAALACGAAHFANPDALLNAFTALTLLCFWRGLRHNGQFWSPALGVASGLAVLAKGPIGLLLPSAVTCGFLLGKQQLRRLGGLRLPATALVFGAVAVPWYVWVALETKGQWLAGFWRIHHQNRVFTAMENHGGPPYYYLLVLIVGLAPWSVFLSLTCWHTWKQLRREGQEPLPGPKAFLRGLTWRRVWRALGEALRSPAREVDDPRSAVQFLVWWVAVYFLPFSLIVQTKLPNYILPAYPALALLTAYFLEQWRRGLVQPPRWAVEGSVACLALMGVGVTVALLVAGGAIDVHRLHGRTLPALAPWAGLGGVLLAGAAVAWWSVRRGRRGAMIGAVAGTALVFIGAMAGWGPAAVDRYKAPRALVQELPADQTLRDLRVATFDYFQPSMVFYCQREVKRLKAEYQIIDFLGSPLPSYLFIPAWRWELLSPWMGRSYRLVARHHDLYDGRDIVVVTNE